VGEGNTNARWRPGAGPATPTIDDDEIVIDLSRDARFGSPTIDLSDRAAAQRYSDWAERLRAKRRRDQDHIRGTEPDGLGSTGGPTQWGSDNLLGGDASAHTGPAPLIPGTSDPLRCLGVLGLSPGATADEVANAYRQLAKVHHPDRWAEADPDVQRHHGEEMLRVNAAYHALRPQLPA
jgi:DnaJ-domain-containing protein 1